jgi:AcrR family transcriptional regulator
MKRRSVIVVIGDRGEPRSGEDRRQALVEAAFRRIAEKGFEGLRLREVAAEAGIDHSTLHHYFPKKEDLVSGVVEYATRQFWWTTPAEGSPAEKLRGHLGALGRMVGERPELFVVMGELDLRASRDEAVRSIVERHEEGWRGVLAEVLEQGVEEGIWAAGLDVPTGVELIIATVKGVRLIPDDAEAVLRQFESLLAPGSLDDRTRSREEGA